jgi:hypothetical protein
MHVLHARAFCTRLLIVSMHMCACAGSLQTRHPTSLPLLESLLEGTTASSSDAPQALQQLSTSTALTTTTTAATTAAAGGSGVSALQSLMNRVLLSDSDQLLLTQAAAEVQQGTAAAAAALGSSADRYALSVHAGVFEANVSEHCLTSSNYIVMCCTVLCCTVQLHRPHQHARSYLVTHSNVVDCGARSYLHLLMLTTAHYLLRLAYNTPLLLLLLLLLLTTTACTPAARQSLHGSAG